MCVEQRNRATSFDALLSAFWLRPETALWRELDIRAMQPFVFRSPSLDLGCGDGTFSFIRAGGRFDEGFDATRTVAKLKQFFDGVDVFDAFDASATPRVSDRPLYRIDCGFDWKPNLLMKARRLSLYSSLQCGNANHGLPYAANSFNSVFSNMVYWLDQPQAVVTEIARVLRPGGEACLLLPNATLPQFSFYNRLYVRTGDPAWAFLEAVDRGRFADNIRHARAGDEWIGMFDQAGLGVRSHVRHLSRTVIQVWDIGLRPLFPVLRRMADVLPICELAGIRREWTATLRRLLLPLVDMDARLNQESEPAFHCFIVGRR